MRQNGHAGNEVDMADLQDEIDALRDEIDRLNFLSGIAQEMAEIQGEIKP
jgi:hypothetical protein